MGRPAIELSEILERRVVEAIEKGATRTCAAQAAGVARSTLFKWLAVGRAGGRAGGDERFAEFADRIRRAEATAELAMSDRLFESGKTDARYALEWLARRRARTWGKRDGGAGPGGLGRLGDAAAARMSDDELRAKTIELAADILDDEEVAALVRTEMTKRRAGTTK